MNIYSLAVVIIVCLNTVYVVQVLQSELRKIRSRLDKLEMAVEEAYDRDMTLYDEIDKRVPNTRSTIR